MNIRHLMHVVTRKGNVVLIMALLLSILGSITPERAFADSGTGTVDYTVLQGQLLNMYASADTGSQSYGSAPAGHYSGKGAPVTPAGWYRLDDGDGKGTVWYFYADPAIVSVVFTPDTAPATATPTKTPSGDGDGGTTSIDLGQHLKLGNLSKLSTGYQVYLLFVSLFIWLLVAILYFAEGVIERRWGLLIWFVLLTGGNAILLAILAGINYKSEQCFFDNAICIANTPSGYFMSGVVLLGLLIGLIGLIIAGAPGHKLGDLSSEEGGRESGWLSPAEMAEFIEEMAEEDMVPLTQDPQIGVGEHDGKLMRTFGKREETKKLELGPVILYIATFTVGMILFAPLGLSYLGPIHFKLITDLSDGLRATAIGLLAAAMIPTLFSFFEMLRENRKRVPLVFIWVVLMAACWFFPWPPVLTMAIFHLISAAADEKFKNFWKGHSDWIVVTFLVGFTMMLLGAPWFFSSVGGWYLNHETWVWDSASAGVQWLRSVIK